VGDVVLLASGALERVAVVFFRILFLTISEHGADDIHQAGVTTQLDGRSLPVFDFDLLAQFPIGIGPEELVQVSFDCPPGPADGVDEAESSEPFVKGSTGSTRL